MRITGVTSSIVDLRLHRTHRHFLCKVGTSDPGDNVRRAVAVRDARPEAAKVRVAVEFLQDYFARLGTHQT